MQKTSKKVKIRIIKHFDEVAEAAHGEYDAKSKRAVKAKEIERNIVLDMLSDIANKRILDAGCGTGRYIEKLVQRNVNIVGIDASINMIKICSEKFTKKEKVKLYVSDIEHTPFKEKSFDVVLCLDILHIFTKNSREFILDNLFKLVVPGGVIIVDVKNSWCPYFWFGWSKKNPVGFAETYSIRSVTRKLKENGCYNIRMKGIYFPTITSPIVIIKSNVPFNK